MTRRSPRAGWVLVELLDGAWHRTATGDRETMRALLQARISPMLAIPADPTRRYSERLSGHAVALYDAVEQRRDEYPTFPRLADGARIDWPSTTPLDGSEPTPHTPRYAPASEAPRGTREDWRDTAALLDGEGSRGASGAGSTTHTEDD